MGGFTASTITGVVYNEVQTRYFYDILPKLITDLSVDIDTGYSNTVKSPWIAVTLTL